MVISCNSIGCVSAAENTTRIRSAKPDWNKAQARFMQNLSMEKERGNTSTFDPSPFASPFGYNMPMKGDTRCPFGSGNINRSPDNYACRQIYLRSYTFSKDEENNKSTIVEKTKRWFNKKKKGKSKAKGKYSFCVETFLKFLLCCITEVDVQAQRPAASTNNISRLRR